MDAVLGQETRVGLISSAPWKIEDFMVGLPKIDPRLVPLGVTVDRGVREVDTVDPDECAEGKLASFMRWTKALDFLNGCKADVGGVVDVLFTLNLHSFTTDRNGDGSLPTLNGMMELITAESCGCRPVTLNIWNTSGWAEMKDLRSHKGMLPKEKVLVSKDRLQMTMSPGVIGLLSNEAKIKKLHKEGLITDDVFTSRAVGGWNWVGFVPLLPAICARFEDDLWMKLQTSSEYYHLDRGLASGDWETKQQVKKAGELLRSYAKGVPTAVLEGIKQLVN